MWSQGAILVVIDCVFICRLSEVYFADCGAAALEIEAGTGIGHFDTLESIVYGGEVSDGVHAVDAGGDVVDGQGHGFGVED